MPPARSARARRRDPATRRPARARPRVLTGGATGIRWDRVSRVALLLVLLVVVYLYAGPARSYWSTKRQAGARSAEVAALRRENARLRAQRETLRQGDALVDRARRLGMVRPGERPYVISNLPK